MITIEDLIEINSKLSNWNLIYRYFSIKWKVFLALIIVIGLLGSLVMLHFIVKDRCWLAFFFGIISFLIGVFFVNFKLKKVKKIIKKKYPYVSNFLSLRKKIDEIQKEEFKKVFRNDNMYEKDNLIFLIDCLQKENQNKIFKFPITVNFLIIIFGSLFFGSFLSGLSNFTDNKLDNYLNLYLIISVFTIMIFSLFFFIENTVIREILDTRRKNRNRLIRILENIYIEKHIS